LSHIDTSLFIHYQNGEGKNQAGNQPKTKEKTNFQNFGRIMTPEECYIMKIVIADIDGTLLNFGAAAPSPLVQEALTRLHQKGILVYAATGRPPYVVPELGFDGIIGFSGGIIQDKEGHVLFADPMPEEQVLQFWRNCQKENAPVVFATDKQLTADRYGKELDDYMKIARQACIPDEHFEDRLHDPVFQGMVALPMEQRAHLLDGCPDLRLIWWHPSATDVVNKHTNKGISLQRLLEALDIDICDSIAFGDGDNDKELLQAAGTSVAMGNASDELKALADAVCESVEQDGFYHELKRRNLI
jgi:hypothetical protein